MHRCMGGNTWVSVDPLQCARIRTYMAYIYYIAYRIDGIKCIYYWPQQTIPDSFPFDKIDCNEL